MNIKSLFKNDERIIRVSEQVQSEGFMVILLAINIIILIKIGIMGRPFTEYKEIVLTLIIVSLFVGVKSVINGAVRGTKAMYNIVLCIITPLIMSMAGIAEIMKNNNLGKAVYILPIVPVIIIIITAVVLVISEKMWLENNKNEDVEE